MDFYKFVIVSLQLLLVQSQSDNSLYKLPETVVPSEYILTIDTNLETLEFEGTVNIAFGVTVTTNAFSLHSKDLTINKITLKNGNIAVNINHNFTTSADLLNIYPTQALTGQNLRLEIAYKGKLGQNNVGYYRAYYLDEHKNNVTMAVTHLEATNARRAFPCFDQPNFKAKFQINLLRKPNQVTSSNMGTFNTTQINSNKVKDVYEPSVTMSTYLVAFMVSEYAKISLVNDGKTYTTFARPELILRGDAGYSLQIAPKAITQMEIFTDFKYPINKMDQVPVPNDYYKIGAMENWGMVTYRERMLMYNTKLSTAEEKQRVAVIIAHEFAHQWFGDLVTPEWWSYIWLNEGFATYFEFYVTSLIETSWDLMEQFITGAVQAALNDDALESSRPMTRIVETPAEIDGIYDTIVYEKAGSVIRMTENFLGTDVFKKGLQSYLKELQYKNTNPTKLYENWQKAYGSSTLNVSDILTSWETQAGYPVLTITRNYASNPNSVSLKQERFYANKKAGTDATTWKIPYDYFNEKTSSNAISWLNTATGTTTINLGAKDWIIFNKGRKGFYRVNYDETNWNLITTFLNSSRFEEIPLENRVQLIDDSFNLARAGRLNYSIAMDIASYLSRETNYFVPVSTFNSVFSSLIRLWVGHDHHANLTKYAINILEPIYKKVGFSVQDVHEHKLKLTIVNVNTWLCNYGYKACLDESKTSFLTWVNQGATIQPDMQSYVYCYGIKEMNQTQINEVYNKYARSSEYTERSRIATALGCVGNNTILLNILQNLLTNNTLIQTDKQNVVTSAYTNNNATGVDVVLQFLTDNFAQINSRIGNVARFITGVGSRITTADQQTKFKTFYEKNGNSMSADLKKTTEAAITSASNNIAWTSENKDQFDSYFHKSSSNILFSSIVIVTVSLFTHYLY